jgi:translation initiation factor 1
MSDNRIVWSDEHGDLRKKKTQNKKNADVDEGSIQLHIKRRTSGKGRTIIEITNLPDNKKWCQKLAKNLKKSLAVGGAYKDGYIEVHGEMLEKVIDFLNSKSLKNKQIGG